MAQTDAEAQAYKNGYATGRRTQKVDTAILQKELDTYRRERWDMFFAAAITGLTVEYAVRGGDDRLIATAKEIADRAIVA